VLTVISARDRDLDLDCDAVVIGSGAGGAVVATMLAEAGRDVVVLEEGPHVPAGEHGRMRPTESVRHVWRDSAMTLAIGLGDSPSINVTAGRMVGGSSALTGGVCFRAHEHVLDAWAREKMPELSAKEMDRFYAQVERDVHVEEVPVEMRSKSTRLFVEGGQKMGLSFHSMRRNTDGCKGCGRCNFGCPEVAKMSVDVAYLPRAVRAGARIVSDCLVQRIDIERDRAVGVRASIVGGAVTVRARSVVVAAGAMYTPLLLLRSGFRSRALGKNLTLHPSFRMIAAFDSPVRGWEGALQSAYCDSFEDDGMILNSVFIPNGVMVAGMPGFGKNHARWRAEVENLALFGGMLHDDGGGRVWRNPFGREPFLTYRMSARDRARVPILLRRMAEIFFSAGAKCVFVPIFGADPITSDELENFPFESAKGRQLECSSQHPLGSCHMGASADAVVDPDGRTWEVKNVWIADGSILPTSLGVNPQLTIMAMAARVASKILNPREAS